MDEDEGEGEGKGKGKGKGEEHGYAFWRDGEERRVVCVQVGFELRYFHFSSYFILFGFW